MKNKVMRFLGQQGMSMVEIMMAVGMLSVVSIGVMQLSKNMNKTSRTATKNFDIEGVMREISQHMANLDNCSATVFGASGSGNTVLTGLKELDATNNGAIQRHPRLYASTTSSPKYVANGMIINGMYLKWKSNTTTGANYDLYVSFMKSVKANSSALAKDMTWGQNIVTRKLPLTLDNCNRFIAVGNTQQAAAGKCNAAGGGSGMAGTAYVSLYSAAGANANAMGVSDTQYFVSCRVCSTRTTVNGCL